MFIFSISHTLLIALGHNVAWLSEERFIWVLLEEGEYSLQSP